LSNASFHRLFGEGRFVSEFAYPATEMIFEPLCDAIARHAAGRNAPTDMFLRPKTSKRSRHLTSSPSGRRPQMVDLGHDRRITISGYRHMLFV
jgi:hypothetical protein